MFSGDSDLDMVALIVEKPWLEDELTCEVCGGFHGARKAYGSLEPVGSLEDYHECYLGLDVGLRTTEELYSFANSEFGYHDADLEKDLECVKREPDDCPNFEDAWQRIMDWDTYEASGVFADAGFVLVENADAGYVSIWKP